jgi:asparagine synthase (glutamine-hydrolysing)
VCGIWGVALRDGVADLSSVEQRLGSALVHRGPDGSGSTRLTDDPTRTAAVPFAIGMTRLSIVDHVTGRQPFVSADGRYVCVVNGEIYNHGSLRRTLRQGGHRFTTESDCETVLHLFEEEGVAFVERLRGMFAVAILDRATQTVVLARDRVGEKPIYYAADDRYFVFASELKAVLCSGLVPFRLDAAAIHAYFHLQFVPEPHTPVQGVRKLPPGHLLTLDLTTLSTRVSRYWSMADAPAEPGKPHDVLVEAIEDVQSVVFGADTPVGVALSGGLDSALVAAMLSRALPGAGHAISVGYAGVPHHDERALARQLAVDLKLHFHEVELSVDDVVRDFPATVRAGDDPIADTAAPGYRAVAAAARRAGVPVLAQGQGGDELFWGYPWVQRAAMRAEAALPPPGAPLEFYQLNSGYAEARREVGRLFPRRMLDGLDPLGPERGFTRLPDESPANAVTRLIMETYLLENGIAQGDRQAMASGVELRLPLLDHQLVTSVLGLRRHSSDVELPPKALLRRAARHWLPAEVTERPKRPFETPVRAWSDALYRRYGGLLTDGLLVEHGVLRPEVAPELAQDTYDATRATPPSYKAMVLEVWVREMLALPGVLTG